MATELKIHDAQTAILRELLFKPSASFSDMQAQTNLASDHFNFHVEGSLFEEFEGGSNIWMRPGDIKLKLKKYFEGLDEYESRYFKDDFFLEPSAGIEPATCTLRMCCSAN